MIEPNRSTFIDLPGSKPTHFVGVDRLSWFFAIPHTGWEFIVSNIEGRHDSLFSS